MYDYNRISVAQPKVQDITPTRPEWKKGLAGFADEMQALGGGAVALAGQATGMEGVRDWGLDVYERNMEESTAGWQAPDVARIEDIKPFETGGMDRLGDWAAYHGTKGLANVASLALSGGIGGAIAKGATKRAVKEVAKSQVGKNLAGRTVTARVKKGAVDDVRRNVTRGAAAGGFVGAFGMEGGGAFGQQVGGGVAPEDALLPSLGVGAVNAALELVAPYQIAKKLGLVGKAREGIAAVIPKDRTLAKKAIELAGKVVKGGASASATEGLTEGIQELVQLAGDRWAKDEELLAALSPEERSQIMNASAAGALVGGGVGGATGPFVQEPTRAPEVQPTETMADIDEATKAAAAQAGQEAGTPEAGPEGATPEIPSTRDEWGALFAARLTPAQQEDYVALNAKVAAEPLTPGQQDRYENYKKILERPEQEAQTGETKQESRPLSWVDFLAGKGVNINDVDSRAPEHKALKAEYDALVTQPTQKTEQPVQPTPQKPTTPEVPQEVAGTPSLVQELGAEEIQAVPVSPEVGANQAIPAPFPEASAQAFDVEEIEAVPTADMQLQTELAQVAHDVQLGILDKNEAEKVAVQKSKAWQQRLEAQARETRKKQRAIEREQIGVLGEKAFELPSTGTRDEQLRLNRIAKENSNVVADIYKKAVAQGVSIDDPSVSSAMQKLTQTDDVSSRWWNGLSDNSKKVMGQKVGYTKADLGERSWTDLPPAVRNRLVQKLTGERQNLNLLRSEAPSGAAQKAVPKTVQEVETALTNELGQGWVTRAKKAGMLNILDKAGLNDRQADYNQETGEITIYAKSLGEGSTAAVALHEGSHATMDELLGGRLGEVAQEVFNRGAQEARAGQETNAATAARKAEQVHYRWKAMQLQRQNPEGTFLKDYDALAGTGKSGAAKSLVNNAWGKLDQEVRTLLDKRANEILNEEAVAYYVEGSAGTADGLLRRIVNRIKAEWLASAPGQTFAKMRLSPKIDDGTAVALARKATKYAVDLREEMDRRGAPSAEGRGNVLESAPDTKAFKNWFKGSKVVDDEGKPLAVYHGTKRDFPAFSEEEQKYPGFFFADTAKTAEFFAGDRTGASEYFQEGGNIGKYYLNMSNPLIVDAKQEHVPNRLDEWLLEVEALDHDGIIINNASTPFAQGTEYVVFEPNQIKSSIGNRGTFDPYSDNVLESAPDTPAFKNWFKDSKVVDDGGKPLVVYHGTTSPVDFTGFSIGNQIWDDEQEIVRTGSDAQPLTFLGAHFAKERPVANQFTEGLYGERAHSREGGRVLPVYLAIQNPYEATEFQLKNQALAEDVSRIDIVQSALLDYATDNDLEEDAAWNAYYESAEVRAIVNETAIGLEEEAARENPEYTFKAGPAIAEDYRASLQEDGFDGVEYENQIEGGMSLIAFEPNQIKSAVGNQGTFDPYSDNVLESIPDTKAFKDWFKDSKVVDDGEPLVVYHGTARDITSFRAGQARRHDPGYFGTGIYFTGSKELSNGYAHGEGANVVPAYLSLQNPFQIRVEGMTSADREATQAIRDLLPNGRLDNLFKADEFAARQERFPNSVKAIDKELDKVGDQFAELTDGASLSWVEGGILFGKELTGTQRKLYRDYQKLGQKRDKARADLEFEASGSPEGYPTSLEIANAKRRDLQTLGYDGVIAYEGDSPIPMEVVAFDGNQIKSAVGNKGTYDDSANILESKVWHAGPYEWLPEPGYPYGRPRLDKVGTGEGGQLFGWGWYAAENEKVSGPEGEYAKSFSTLPEEESLGTKIVMNDGRSLQAFLNGHTNPDASIIILEGLDFVDPSKVKTVRDFERALAHESNRLKENTKRADAYNRKYAQEEYDTFTQIANDIQTNVGTVSASAGKPASIFRLEIPDEHIDRMIQWEKAPTEQTPEVQAALRKITLKPDGVSDFDLSMYPDLEMLYMDLMDVLPEVPGEHPKKKVSNYLQSLGIVGNKFLDFGSRGEPKTILVDKQGIEVPVESLGPYAHSIIDALEKHDGNVNKVRLQFQEQLDVAGQEVRDATSDWDREDAEYKMESANSILDTLREFKRQGYEVKTQQPTYNYVVWDQDVLNDVAHLNQETGIRKFTERHAAELDEIAKKADAPASSLERMSGVLEDSTLASMRDFADNWISSPLSAHYDEVTSPRLLNKLKHYYVEKFNDLWQMSKEAATKFNLATSKKASAQKDFEKEFIHPWRDLMVKLSEDMSKGGKKYSVEDLNDAWASWSVVNDNLNVLLARRNSNESLDQLNKEIFAFEKTLGAGDPTRVRLKELRLKWEKGRKNLLAGKTWEGTDPVSDDGVTPRIITSAEAQHKMMDKLEELFDAPVEGTKVWQASEKLQELRMEWEMMKYQGSGLATPDTASQVPEVRAELENIIELHGDRAPKNAYELHDAVKGNASFLAAVPKAKEIAKRGRDALVKGELITREEADVMGDMYKHWMPLQREDYDYDESVKKLFGRGQSSGKLKTRAGTSKVNPPVHTMQNLMASFDASITAMEGNLARKYLADEIQANPDHWGDWFEVTQDKDAQRSMGKYGFIQTRKAGGEVVDIPFYRNGERWLIKPNTANNRAVMLSNAIQNLDSQELGPVFKMMNKVNSWIRWTNISASPAFLLMNAPRDYFTAMLNLKGTELADFTKDVRKEVGPSLKALNNHFRKGIDDPEIREWEEAGGRISFVESLRPNDEAWGSVEAQIRHRQGNFNFGPGMEANFGPGVGVAVSKGRDFLERLETINIMAENVMRYSTWKVAKRQFLAQGMTEQQAKNKAALLSKDVTTNFDRKGLRAQTLGTYWLFYNATVQGNAQVIRNMFEGANKQKLWGALAGVAAFAFINDQLGAELSDDEDGDGRSDWDSTPEWKKEKFGRIAGSNVLWPGEESTFATVPLPWVFNTVWRFGEMVSESMRGVKDSTEIPADMVGLMLNTFNPLGGSDTTPMQMAAPTAVDPIVQILENTSAFGRPLGPTQYPGQELTPDSELSWLNTPPRYKWLARQINDITGGTTAEKGLVDWRPSTYKVLADTLMGGGGRFLEQLVGSGFTAATGKAPEVKEVPFIKPFLFAPGDPIEAEKYHERMAKVEQAKYAEKTFMKGPQRDLMELQRVRADYAGELRMVGMANDVERQLKDLRKQLRMAQARGQDSRVDFLKGKMEKAQERFNKTWASRVGN